RTYLNTSFSETPGSRKREGRPTALVHPRDAAELGIADGGKIRIGNRKGEVSLHAEISDAAKPGIVISEGVWPDDAFEGGIGINLLIDATPVPPAGGAAFHDTAIWLKAAAEEIASTAD
ncbi:MAG: molybdopterin dinucleotide binding domain-containing protein, partial [Pseudomonadota bacterium]|nr:molybdopterin dinucleotide binding domain-containing protein [Pseudomonadota bacterium]